jgi:hypothetical protein
MMFKYGHQLSDARDVFVRAVLDPGNGSGPLSVKGRLRSREPRRLLQILVEPFPD